MHDWIPIMNLNKAAGTREALDRCATSVGVRGSRPRASFQGCECVWGANFQVLFGSHPKIRGFWFAEAASVSLGALPLGAKRRGQSFSFRSNMFIAFDKFIVRTCLALWLFSLIRFRRRGPGCSSPGRARRALGRSSRGTC